MSHDRILRVLIALALPALCGADWRGYHGSDGTSVAAAKHLPVEFGPEKSVAWKVPLPGPGPSCPIVVGDRVIVTCGSGPQQARLHVLCFDSDTGKPLWQRQMWATGQTLFHPFGGIAIPTPVSDGRRVVVFYSSNDLACFDLEGNLAWHRGLAFESPTTRNDVGMASSPRIVGDVVLVQMENQGHSFAAGIDLASGETRWQHDREHVAVWASPLILPGKSPGAEVLLMQSRSRLTGNDPRTGRLLWSYDADVHTVATGTVCGDVVYLPSDGGLAALRVDQAAGRVDVLWKQTRLRLENTSPIVHDGRVYAIKSPGILVCGKADSGEVLWQVRLKGPIWATPVLADGKIYVVNHDGLVQVVALDNPGKLLASNELEKGVLASPAVAEDALYFRTNTSLWKIAK